MLVIQDNFLTEGVSWMIKDEMVRSLIKTMNKTNNITFSANKAGMNRKTASKYLNSNRFPSENKGMHNWVTRADPFKESWDEIVSLITLNQGLEAKTIFEYLQRENPGKYQDGQLRTLQRKIKQWRGLYGKAKEVYFDQIHIPGELSQSDFTYLNDLQVTINGEHLRHMIYHFVLTYSNWETGTVCYSESFESLSSGFQNALFKLGGVPHSHQTDRLTACVQKPESQEEFTDKYKSLLDYYRIKGRKTQARSPNENGDVEQRHHRFKRALDQQLMLRSSRDFSSINEYEKFLDKLFSQLNSGRHNRFQEEQQTLRCLPWTRQDSFTRLRVKVSRGSTIRVYNNTYSVHSRLIGESVTVHLYVDHLEVFYAQKRVESIERIRGDNKHHIQYRHIIDWLVRKPGAFANYRYKSDLFPSSIFRICYDNLKETQGKISADKEYLKILLLASKEGEDPVEDSIKVTLQIQDRVNYEDIRYLVQDCNNELDSIIKDVNVESVDIKVYDDLLEEVSTCIKN